MSMGNQNFGSGFTPARSNPNFNPQFKPRVDSKLYSSKIFSRVPYN
jgi:hypothetical protein